MVVAHAVRRGLSCIRKTQRFVPNVVIIILVIPVSVVKVTSIHTIRLMLQRHKNYS